MLAEGSAAEPSSHHPAHDEPRACWRSCGRHWPCATTPAAPPGPTSS